MRISLDAGLLFEVELESVLARFAGPPESGLIALQVGVGELVVSLQTSSRH